MEKVALGMAGSRFLATATMAELWLKVLKKASRDCISRTRHQTLSSNFCNKNGKFKIRRIDFESAASASSAIPALLRSA
jgi:hypothetical protein